MLFCLVKREQTKNNDDLPDMEWGIRDGHRNPSAFYLSKRDPKWTDVVTRDFNALTDSDAIVKYVEAYVTSIPPDWKKKRMTLGVPVESPAFKQLWSGSSVGLVVPADPQMETLGRAWCNDKSAGTRAQGTHVLGNFKNDENIKILKSLLSDPDFHIIQGSQSFPDQIVRREYRSYPARYGAFEALRELGVKVDRPSTEVTLKETVEKLKRNEQ